MFRHSKLFSWNNHSLPSQGKSGFAPKCTLSWDLQLLAVSCKNVPFMRNVCHFQPLSFDVYTENHLSVQLKRPCVSLELENSNWDLLIPSLCYWNKMLRGNPGHASHIEPCGMHLWDAQSHMVWSSPVSLAEAEVLSVFSKSFSLAHGDSKCSGSWVRFFSKDECDNSFSLNQRMTAVLHFCLHQHIMYI